MGIEFIRVYDNGIFIVAEFRRLSPVFYGNGRRSDVLVLNEKNLRERIENNKQYGLSVTEEIAGLSAIEVYKRG